MHESNSMRLKDVKKKVFFILEKHEKARNNDWTLFAHFINYYCNNLTTTSTDGRIAIELHKLQHLPSMESVRRSRQIIQNDDGIFPPTDEKVKKARNIKEMNWTNAEVREAKQTQMSYDR